MGDDSDYLIKSFQTRQEAEAYIRHRNEEHPQDELYEHWYVKSSNQMLEFPGVEPGDDGTADVVPHTEDGTGDGGQGIGGKM